MRVAPMNRGPVMAPSRKGLDDGAAFELVLTTATGHHDVEQITQRLVTRPN